MKHFTVTITVVNCGNCPYRYQDGNENYYCSKGGDDHFSSQRIVRQNMEKITESCPFYSEAKE